MLRLPDRPPLHVFIELDRGTETLGRLQEKATRYRKALRWKDVRKLDPLVLLVVPSAGRAETVSTALAGGDAPFAVVMWSKNSTTPDTAALQAVADQLGRTIAHGHPDQAKALLRILIAELRVNSRSPTHLPPQHAHGFARRQVQWAILGSNQ